MLEKINNKVFVYFCRNPHSSAHIRELARILKISAPTCIELIKELEKNDLIKKRKIGKSILVSPNLNDKFIFYKRWVNLFLLLDSGLVQQISKENPGTFVIFGSYSRGEDIEKSDIDIALDVPFKQDLSKYEKILNRNIQIHLISKNMPKNLIENIRQGILVEGVMI